MGAAPRKAAMRKIPGMVGRQQRLQMPAPVDGGHRSGSRLRSGVTAGQVEDALLALSATAKFRSSTRLKTIYQVIMELLPRIPARSEGASNSTCRSSGGRLVPLDAVTHAQGTGALQVTHSGQLPAVTISFDLRRRFTRRGGHAINDAVSEAHAATVRTLFRARQRSSESSSTAGRAAHRGDSGHLHRAGHAV